MQTRGRLALRRAAYPAAASPHHGLPVASTWRPRAKGTDGVAVRYPQGGGSIPDVGLVMITSSYMLVSPGTRPEAETAAHGAPWLLGGKLGAVSKKARYALSLK
jgi:hypothetical protein